ncbi:hypothetical protein M413DRAFT_31660 [Hebeloma cylindrosporum]|uniref:Uncharacterized protein n=1 Tax=Hebeloma cylindrosporum TaxID=76867 RepID=A0A0C2Y5T8_HEBCY|nr:hypothetical protein M413DRAFT_31660 [Hebeloma cylindrosporum h7]
MDADLNLDHDGHGYQFNSNNHLPALNLFTDHQSPHPNINVPRLMLSSGQRHWPHSRTPTEDWPSSPLASAISRGGSRSVSQLSTDTSQASNMARELEEAKQTILILQTKLDTISQAFSAVVGAVPSLLHVANPLGQKVPLESRDGSHLVIQKQRMAPLDHANYPSIKFWHDSEWRSYCKEMKAAASDKSIVSDYMEDEHGRPVSSERASEIREVASTLWFEMVEKGRAPPKWSEAAADVKSFYYAAMDESCQEMRYCHNHWKAQYLATKNYSSFYNNHGRKGPSGAIKKEPEAAVANEKTQKRGRGDIEEENKDKASKKTKRTHQDKPVNALPNSNSTSSPPTQQPDDNAEPFKTAEETGMISAAIAAVATEPPSPQPFTIPRILFSNPQNHNPTSRPVDASLPPPPNSLPASRSIAEPTPVTLAESGPIDGAPATSIQQPEQHMHARIPINSEQPQPTPSTLPAQPEPTQAAIPESISPQSPQPTPNIAASVAGKLKGGRKIASTDLSDAVTPRNLCKREWCVKYPEGSNAEFAVYWTSLKGTEEEARFLRKARETKAAVTAAAAASGTGSTSKGPKTRRTRAGV